MLVAGGIDNDRQALAVSEIFDPDAQSWRSPIPLNEPRFAHTATVLSDGTLLIAGGYGADGAPLASAERFNGSTWVRELPMNEARAEHTATVLPNGDVVLIGGGPLSVETYTPTVLGGHWAAATGINASRVRYGHRASLTFGRILVTGGSAAPFPSRDALDSFESYVPGVPGRWEPEQHMLHPHVGHTATVLDRTQEVLVVGGGPSAELYDPIKSVWSATREMHSVREFHAAETLNDDDGNQRVLVVGGFFQQLTFGTAEVYNPIDQSWSLFPGGLGQKRVLHTITRLEDARSFMVIGGRSGFGPVLDTGEVIRIGSLATSCTGDDECLSGHCADAVCCNRSCDGSCEVCDGTGATRSGTCGLAPLGPDGCCSESGCQVDQGTGGTGGLRILEARPSPKTPLSCSASSPLRRRGAHLAALMLTLMLPGRRAARSSRRNET